MKPICARFFDAVDPRDCQRILAQMSHGPHSLSPGELLNYNGMVGLVYRVPTAMAEEAQSAAARGGVAVWLLPDDFGRAMLFAGQRGAIRELCDLWLMDPVLVQLAAPILKGVARPVPEPLEIGFKPFDFSRTYLMGILNVTPDSFSDGGKYSAPSAALARGRELAAAGADIVDVGGESTRPGAKPVSESEELKRVIPVVNGLARAGICVSIDTRKAAVARSAVDAGAAMINDVGGLRDPEMLRVVAECDIPVVVMHMRGDPETMQNEPGYTDVVSEIIEELLRSVSRAVAAGVRRENIWLDPGIGFGKTLQHNLTLLKHAGEFATLGHPVVLGTSRKSFIGKLLDRPADQRELGTAATLALAVQQGVHMLRVHDVGTARDVVCVADAIRRAPFR